MVGRRVPGSIPIETAFNFFRATPKQVKDFHNNSDADSGKRALHHTLGRGAFQAASGTDLTALEAALTPVTVNITADLTAAAGWTLTTCRYTKWGPLVSVRLRVTRTGGDMTTTSGGNVSPDISVIATALPAEIRPSYNARGNFGRELVQDGWGYISTAGAISFTNGLPSVTYVNSVEYIGQWTYMLEGWTP